VYILLKFSTDEINKWKYLIFVYGKLGLLRKKILLYTINNITYVICKNINIPSYFKQNIIVQTYSKEGLMVELIQQLKQERVDYILPANKLYNKIYETCGA